MNRVYACGALQAVREVEAKSVRLIYVDPPYNTGVVQRMHRVSRGELVSDMEYADIHVDFREWLMEIIGESRRVLTDDGSIFVHLDWREVHYIKVAMDALFGMRAFMNEIVWAFDFGGRPKGYWPRKHHSILWYARNPDNYVFNFDSLDRIPYMAPGLVGKEKAARGKTPTDVWWNTIVPTNGPERTGYPNQKPLAIVERIVRAHSNEGDTVMDFFAGSGTTGEAAYKHRRRFILADTNPQAISTMRARFARIGIGADSIEWVEHE